MHILVAFTIFWSLKCHMVQMVGGQLELRKSTSEWALLQISGPSLVLSLIVFYLEPSGLNHLHDSLCLVYWGAPNWSIAGIQKCLPLDNSTDWAAEECKQELTKYILAWDFVRPSSRELLPPVKLLQGTGVNMATK